NNAEFNTYFTHYSDSIGLIHCDLTPEFKHQSQSLTLYLSDDTHWNQNGNRLAAELISRFIQ
ncbi:MAG: hypothetical protein KBA26_09820, partial [Candidatus Delongbacteria bacterium]|nr:hypothetical protein [Candidatus Delongbacteria bacterium]